MLDELRNLPGQSVPLVVSSAPGVLKIDERKQQITTQVMSSFHARNLNGWRMIPGDIADALDSYMSSYQLVGRMHTEVTNSYPVRAWQDEVGNGWITRQVVDQQDWDKVRSGYYGGTSWAGTGRKVFVDEVLASQLGIPSDWYMTDVTYIEDSYVDVPADTGAVLNGEDLVHNADDEWLINQVLAGTVEPRVKRPAQTLMQRAADVLGQGLSLLMQSLNPAQSGGESNTMEGLDMERDDVIQIFNECNKPIVASLDEIKNSLAAMSATGGEGAESGEELDAETVINVTLDEAKVTELVTNAVKPLEDKIAEQAETIKSQAEKIELLSKAPGISQRIVDVGEDSKPKTTRHRSV